MWLNTVISLKYSSADLKVINILQSYGVLAFENNVVSEDIKCVF
jgi:hypothetical protein